MRKSSTILFLIILVVVATCFIVFRHSDQQRLQQVTKDLTQCQKQTLTSSCNQFSSNVKRLPATLPDPTAGWTTYSIDKYFSLTFSHPANIPVKLETGSGDIVMRHVYIGSTIILEAVSGGSDGVAGGNPADYERIVFNNQAQRTKPNWDHYAPGYSSEVLGAMTLYRFHTNILDDYKSQLDPSTYTPSASNGLPMQGVMFDTEHHVDWLVFFKQEDEKFADNVLRTMSFTSK